MFITKKRHAKEIAYLDNQIREYANGIAARGKVIDKLKKEITAIKADLTDTRNQLAQARGRLVAFAHKHNLPAPSEEEQ